MNHHDERDEVAITAWIAVSDVPRVDALADLYRKDRRAILRELIALGLRAVVDGALPVIRPVQAIGHHTEPQPVVQLRIGSARRIP
ncbi:hypothetical protein [Paraburkholderia adhaesiva]|uniref:hypothetical protein n=1 Tax=Paraburkholderia adhaesiva TaxID=2883244 RepID=UPI001F3CC214|nr:hypothetical protein [Paraburkholderia adhaesiva]